MGKRPIQGGRNMKEIVDLIVSNGMSVVIIAYLLFRDYKFTDKLDKSLESINETLAILKKERESD